MGAQLLNLLDPAVGGAQKYIYGGTASLPGLAIWGDANTGIFSGTADQLKFSTGGTQRGYFSSAGLTMATGNNGLALLSVSTASSTVPVHTFAGDTDTGLGTAGANILTLVAGGKQAFSANTAANAVNYCSTTPAALGAPPSIDADGTDVDVDLLLRPQGAGLVSFGTYVNVPLISAGFITIKDAAGNNRNLMVG